MSKIVKVALGILVRQDKIVYVSVPNNFDSWEDDKKRDLLRTVYDADDGTDFRDDESWGCEEATHVLLGDAPDMDANFFANADGELVEEGDAQDGERPEEEA